MKFESKRPPVINKSDLMKVTELLCVFDRITFNDSAEMLAQFDAELGLFGKVTFSLYVRENHLKVWRISDDADLFSGYLNDLLNPDLPIERGDIISKVMAELKRLIAA